ncbi:hypothetical protein B9Z19DRAFT_1062087 [Tuber borchii]|uniref:Uncharacterized protein n=1 Tax=Tuber borchii TaxID=42251 RepID=A0A2T7A2Q0_TUBBO|nr:hypothetical protein B9Z19DRAFT_1062087 [Tuber borchii]
MPSIKLLQSSALGGGNAKGQELGKPEETTGEQTGKRQENEVPESLFTDLATSSYDAHNSDIEAAMALLELASGSRIPAGGSMATGNGGVPLSEGNGNASAGGTDGSRPAGSFAGAHILGPSAVVSTPLEDTQGAAVLPSAYLDQGHRLDLNPVAAASPEDVQAAAILFSIYLDQTRSRDAALE